MKKDFARSKKEYIDRFKTNKETAIDDFFQQTVGRAIKTQSICLSEKSNIFLRSCEVKGEPLKLIYTVGLSLIQKAELIFCLPQKWDIRQFFSDTYFFEETFPIDILKELIKKSERKNSDFSIEEGLYIEKNKSPWNKLNWDSSIKGLILLNLNWTGESSSEIDNDEDVLIDLLVLFPILESDKLIKKQDLKEWIKTQRNNSWKRVSLPYNDLIDWQKLLNESIDKHNVEGVKTAIEKGANVNYGYIAEHNSFGFYSQETLLGIALSSKKNEKIIPILVENGAIVPKNALAKLINWGSRLIYELLISKGADINAESVNMTALERAIAFKNTECIQYLIELGAKERKK